MTVRKKTILIISATIAILIAFISTISGLILLKASSRHEERQTAQDAQRVADALNNEIASLARFNNDWSGWDETYKFVLDGNRAYAEANLTIENFIFNKYSLICYVNNAGQIVVAKAIDRDSRREIPVPQEFLAQLGPGGLLLQHPDIRASHQGVLLLPQGPMLVASHAILTSDFKGPSHGTLIVGLMLNATEIKLLAKLTHLAVTVHRMDDVALPPDVAQAREALGRGQAQYVKVLSPNRVAGYVPVRDIYGKPALLLRVEVPRLYHKQFLTGLHQFLISIIILGLVMGLVVVALLDRLVLLRLARLGTFVKRIGTGREALASRVVVAGDDELATLAGSINAMLEGIERDLAMRQQTENSLRLNEARLDALVRLSQMQHASRGEITAFVLEEGVRLTKSTIGYLAFVNEDESILTMHAWSMGALEHCRVKDKNFIIPTKDTGLWGEAVRQRRPIITNDYRLPSPAHKGLPEGHVPLLRHMNVPIFGDAGHIVAVAGVGNKTEPYDDSDVRQLNLLMDGMWSMLERKRAEEALRESEERFRGLFENAALGIFHASFEGRLLRCNPSFARMFGYASPAQVMAEVTDVAGQLFVEPGRFHATVRQLVEGAGMLEGVEDRYHGREGTVLTGLLTARLVVDDSRDFTYMEGFLEDISARKQLEEQLLQTQKLDAIGQLAGGVAHDFNNLLTGILGHANLLNRQVDPASPLRESLCTIERAAERAAELTRQLLGFARRGKDLSVPVELNASAREVIGLLSRTLDKQIRISANLDAEGWVIMGDPGQIQQVILNLAVNARDAMAHGGEMTIETALETLDEEACRVWLGAEPGRYVRLTVGDTGCGIPAEFLEHIFEPFFTTKEEGKGTGMGLAMVYGIIKNHGGLIRVESEVGWGTRIHICLPCRRKDEAYAQDEEVAQPPNLGSCGRVLLVDDQEVVREVATAMLTALGYAVVSVGSAREAIEFYRHAGEQIDLVILDLVMPEMDGRECFRALRQINPHVRALLSTGYGLDGRIQEILEEGMCGFIKKPYTVHDLSTIMASACPACQPACPAAPASAGEQPD